MSNDSVTTPQDSLTSESVLNNREDGKKPRKKMMTRLALFFSPYMPRFVKDNFWKIDKKVDGSISFFFRHFGKTKFMVAMSKKIQYLGMERVFLMDRWEFAWFFMLYLIRDLLLYIALPIYIARLVTS